MKKMTENIYFYIGLLIASIIVKRLGSFILSATYMFKLDRTYNKDKLTTEYIPLKTLVENLSFLLLLTYCYYAFNVPEDLPYSKLIKFSSIVILLWNIVLAPLVYNAYMKKAIMLRQQKESQ